MPNPTRPRLTPHELAMHFVLWAEQLRTPLSRDAVIGHFEVSRATAYRLINLYLDAKGLPPNPHSQRLRDARAAHQAGEGAHG